MQSASPAIRPPPASPEFIMAKKLHRLDFNVFPLPAGKKGGFPWKSLTYTRLQDMHLPFLFKFQCNIAVMMGRTSGNLFVIDCETEAALKEHVKNFRLAGIPIWMVKTNGKGNGGHLYLRCAEGEVENIRSVNGRNFEIRGNGCYVLCPPSVHPDTGAFYEWGVRETETPPTVKLEQLHWLNLRLAQNRRPLEPKNPHADLSAQTRDFLYNGAREGERNNRLFSAACDMHGNGYSYSAVVKLLVTPASRSGLAEGEIRKTITSAFKEPRNPAKPYAYEHHFPHPWERAQIWAENYEWTGRTAETDRAVMLACCKRAAQDSTDGTFRAACREIGEIACVNFKTASKALRRLVEAGYLINDGQRDRKSDANLYRFGSATQTISPDWYTKYIPLLGESCVPLSPLFPDAGELGALNKAAYRIYDLMRQVDEPLTVKQWAKLALVSPSKMYRALKRLRQWGLIVAHAEHRYSAILKSDGELNEEIARPAGTLGKGQKRRLTHQKHRSGHAFHVLIKAVARENGVVWRGPESW